MGFKIAILLVFGAGSALAQFPRQTYPPPPGFNPQPAAPSASGTSMPGTGGQVMYFCKPADASIPQSGSGGSVAQASDPGISTPGMPTIPSMPVQAAQPAPSPVAQPLPPPSPPSFPDRTVPAQQPLEFLPSNQPTPIVQPLILPTQPYQPDRSSPQQPLAYAPTNQAPMGQQPNTAPSPRPYVAPATILPNREDIFRMRNNAQLEKWVMDKVGATVATGVGFPPIEAIGDNKPYVSKTAQYPPQQATIEPTYLVHRRLLFEELNAERYGWDLGILQPIVSVGYFYKDFMLLPGTLITGFSGGFWDSNAGKCMPGSPTPYMLYPPGLSLSGWAAEGAVITGLSFAIP